METNQNRQKDETCIVRLRKNSNSHTTSIKYLQKKTKMIGDYQILQKIGEGSGGKVKLAVDKLGQKYAIKIFNKFLLKKKVRIIKDEQGNQVFKNALSDTLHEIEVIQKLCHNNIIKFKEVLEKEESDKMYLVQEYADFGELIQWDEVNATFNFQWNDQLYIEEDLLRKIFRDCVKGLNYLHENRIIHRDIKPQNILVNKDGVTKLCDLGASIQLKNKTDLLKCSTGTYHFMSPESIKGNPQGTGFSGQLSDIWSLGVTFYCFVFKKIPFYHDSLIELFKQIQNQQIDFKSEKRKISAELQCLLEQMIQKSPQKRIDMKGIIKNTWINQNNQDLEQEIQSNATVHNLELASFLKNECTDSLNIIKSVTLSNNSENLREFDSQEKPYLPK